MKRVLDQGWAGQQKIHGHRAQIHLGPGQTIVYNRHGQLAARELDLELDHELRRVLGVTDEWVAVDAEWLKPEGKIFLFDYLKFSGVVLFGETYLERWQRLPRVYRSKHISTLKLLRTVKQCLTVYEQNVPHHEGLVFKSLNSSGFSDTSIIRCRKPMP